MNNQLIKQNQGGALVQFKRIDNIALNTLLPEQRKIIEAGLQPKIKAQPPVDVVLALNGLITGTFTRAGFKVPDSKTLALYADETYSELMLRYPGVTIPEVQEALKQGVYGEYGEFIGLNPRTFLQFVKAYLFAESRKEAMKQFEESRGKHVEEKKLSPEEKEQSNREFVNILYQDHKDGKLIFYFIPLFLFDFLESTGKLKLSLEEKKAIEERAAKFVEGQQEQPTKQPRTIGSRLKQFLQGNNNKQTIIMLSKQIAIVDLFEANIKANAETIFPI